MKFKKNKQEVTGVSLIDSLKISENFYSKQENRLLTLALKGLIVYLVTAGMIGCALTATNTYFNQIAFNVVVAFLSVVISLIYYNKKTENWGDIIYLMGIIILGFFLAAYINSGFYTWMNDITGTASVYFDLPDIGGYNQMITGSITVTIAACYLGGVAVILINMSIAKRMMYGDLVLDALIILLLPLYFELEPGFLYFTMLVLGVLFASVWRNTGRYTKVDNNSVYIKTKKTITYTYNVKAHFYTFIQIGIVCLGIIILFFIVVPKDLYNLTRTKSSSKDVTDEYVETFITSGIAGFFNRYESTGGMNSGRLGGISSVRMDYKPDIRITYTPFNYEPVYLRTFIGGDYVPYRNMWLAADKSMVNNYEYQRLKDMYNSNNKYSGCFYMDVENIEAEVADYSLYYTDENEYIHRGEVSQRIIYPYSSEMGDYLENSFMNNTEKKYWLSVPKDNVPSVISTLNKINIPQEISVLEKADYIKYYYLTDIPYTLRPGATPYRKDFVNFFLDTNKKGYCTHFASAATLMFRYMGIPARYVEGYVFDYSQSSDITIENGLNASEYSDGYSKLDNMPVITAILSDANAHAWVEIFVEGRGWVPVELTPPSSDTDNYNEISFMDRFMNIFSPDNNSVDSEEKKLPVFDPAVVRKIFIYIISFAAAIMLAVLVFNIGMKIYIYKKADINTKLIIKYHSFIKHKKKKHKELNEAFNYHDQMVILTDDFDKAVSILNKAGFSDKEITKEEFDYVVNAMKIIK